MPSIVWRFWRRRSNGTAARQHFEQFQQIILTHKYVVALFAFLVSVDLIEIVGVLCYQLFTASYFPWHLYPMMLNRAVELVAFICSRGYIPSLYSVAQILLSLLSLAVYAKRQPCNKYNCAAPLVLYSILLCYQIFVAIMVVKVSRMPMADDDGQIIANWPTTQISPAADFDDNGVRPLGIQIIGLSPRAMRARIISQVVPQGGAGMSGTGAEKSLDDVAELIYAVQQPDGHKLAIARLCKDLLIDDSCVEENLRPGEADSAHESHPGSCNPSDMIIEAAIVAPLESGDNTTVPSPGVAESTSETPELDSTPEGNEYEAESAGHEDSAPYRRDALRVLGSSSQMDDRKDAAVVR